MYPVGCGAGEGGGRQRAAAVRAARGGHGALRVRGHAREHRQRQGARRVPRRAPQGTPANILYALIDDMCERV